MADRKELKTVKRGRPKKENCANDVCRVCETNLRVKYGSSTSKSFVNLFKPSLRDESFGVVWAERLRNIAGITVIDSVRSSQLACNVCLRKIKNLCELLEFISKRLGSEQQTADRENDAKNCDFPEGTKRKFLAVLSPTSKSSPSNKSLRFDRQEKKGRIPGSGNLWGMKTQRSRENFPRQCIPTCCRGAMLMIWIHRKVQPQLRLSFAIQMETSLLKVNSTERARMSFGISV